MSNEIYVEVEPIAGVAGRGFWEVGTTYLLTLQPPLTAPQNNQQFLSTHHCWKCSCCSPSGKVFSGPWDRKNEHYDHRRCDTSTTTLAAAMDNCSHSEQGDAADTCGTAWVTRMTIRQTTTNRGIMRTGGQASICGQCIF